MKKTTKTSDGSMSPSGHLRELRNRILVCLVLLVIAFGACLSMAPRIVTMLTDMGEKYSYVYVYIAPQELFLVYMNVALVAAVAICAPIFVYEIYAFCSPGLSQRESTYILGSLVAGGVCFLVGIAFAYLITKFSELYHDGSREIPCCCYLSSIC